MTPVKKTVASPAYHFSDATDRAEWDAFVTSHPEANFLQSWDFYEFHRARGNTVVRRIARADSQNAQDADSQNAQDADSQSNGAKSAKSADSQAPIVAAYAGVVETAKRGRHLAIAGGPILDWNNRALVAATFADIKASGEREHCVFVRVRPQLPLSDDSLRLMRELGLKKAPMYLSVEFAGVLDLTKSEEEILAGMRQRLRRALRKAAKNGLTITKSTDPAALHEFYQIQLQTAGRHEFVAFSEDFLTKQFAAFAPNGEAVLYTAKKDGEVLVQNFMIFYGDEASYHYGVSSELGTKFSGAPLLHLEAMRDARARGIKRYNLWGIVDEDDTKHRFYGVSCFKRGFGVDELKYTPAHDLVLEPAKYQLTRLIETVRKKVRHV